MSKDYLKILKAKPEDVEGIYQVRKITWLDTYPNEDFGIGKKEIEEKFIEIEKNFNQYLEERKKRLRKKQSKSATWVANIDNQVVGFCMAEKGKKIRLAQFIFFPNSKEKGSVKN